MSEHNLARDTIGPSNNSARASFWWGTLPYGVILTLAILGVAYTSISRQPLAGYWEFLALAIGVFCVVTQWPKADGRQARFRLIWVQALHWATFLVMMNIMLLPSVQSLVPAPANSLALLMLLALGTFLAGVHLLSLQICFLGLALGLAVPAIAWLKQAALFLILAAVLLIGLGIALWPTWGKKNVPQFAKDTEP